MWSAELDPDERFLYVMAIESVNPDPELMGRLVGGYTSRLSRFRYDDGEAGPLETILSGLPAGAQHPGGALTFGPDGHLYLTIGDSTTEWLASVPRSLVGSILRLKPAGSVPEDNPFRGSLVYAYGFRNPYGIAFHPRNGMLYVTDNGPDCCDRFLRVERGRFHGWPLYGWRPEDLQRAREDPEVVPPLIDSGAARVAPTQLVAYSGERYGSEFDGNLFFGTFRDGTLRRVVLSDDGRSLVSDEIVWASDPREGVTGLTVAPDGHIYFTTPGNLYRVNDFDGEPGAPPAPRVDPDSPVARGRALFDGKGGCAGCHTIAGISLGLEGPELSRIGAVAAMRRPGMSAREYLAESIREPEAFIPADVPLANPGIMVDALAADLSDREIDDLVDFLLTQD